MQLVAMGAQDVYLTGNPQITFFKVVYRRHTNFSKECIAQTFSGSVPKTTEGSVTCTLARNGDLVQEIYLKTTVEANDSKESGIVTLNATDNKLSVVDATSAWVDTLASATSSTTVVYFTQDLYNYNVTPPATTSKVLTANTRYNMTVTKNSGVFVAAFTDMDNNAIVISGASGSMIGDSEAAITIAVGNSTATTYSGKIVKEDIALDNTDMTDLIKTVEVEIGGQKIDKHYSQWLDIYNELFETSHDLRFAMCNGSQSAPNVNEKIHYIPLRFWFNRNPGLALPLIALQYHEVKINMTLNPARSAGSVTMSDAKLLVNYLYLDTDERRRFAQVSHEYLIEQVQHTGVESESPITMNFNHPVKALFWTAYGSSSAPLGAAKLQLNGHDRAAVQPHDYYHLVQPYESGLGHSGKSLNNDTRIWGPVVNTGDHNNVGMYSFCLKPAEHQPSGTCNFSRIDNARLIIDKVSSTNNLYLFAMNYNVLRIMSGMGGLAYSN
jgi:hypothetical protein